MQVFFIPFLVEDFDVLNRRHNRAKKGLLAENKPGHISRFDCRAVNA